ncbi:MAG: N-acetylneuraminate synthase family protein, partial [Lachnospiraceae bacterium]|nr:N-acetylneuraminate synthase family protein [Lachnospiraceae bacterium]
MKEKVRIIAEAGINYNGDIDLAARMVKVAKAAGADVIKFQTGKPKNSISVYAKKAEYQAQQTNSDESQLEMCEKLMLPEELYPKLVSICREEGIEFLSTPFDIESVELLASLGVHLWKIPSGEIISLPLLLHIARKHEPVILSTGMSTLREVQTAIRVLQENGAGEITVLQCNTGYPTPYEDANVLAMVTMRERFGVKVGYSDHTSGIIVPVMAAALGATIIEKHFTLDRSLPGPDQA